jgi:hypothetical protein
MYWKVGAIDEYIESMELINLADKTPLDVTEMLDINLGAP